MKFIIFCFIFVSPAFSSTNELDSQPLENHSFNATVSLAKVTLHVAKATGHSIAAAAEINAIQNGTGDPLTASNHISSALDETVLAIEDTKTLKDNTTKLSELEIGEGTASLSSASAVVKRPIPPIAHGHEAVYRRFMNGRLVYRGEKSFSIADVVNESLEGEFNLSGLTYIYEGDRYHVANFLRIKVGYRTAQENDGKITVWIVPKFMIDQSNSAWRNVEWSSDIGLFWSFGNWDLLDYEYITNKSFDEISSEDLNSHWVRACKSRLSTKRVCLRGLWFDSPYTLFYRFSIFI